MSASAIASPTRLGLPRWALWSVVVSLVFTLLGTLVWLASRYEVSQVQSRLDRDAAEALGNLRATLSRNVQSLQALHFNQPTPGSWAQEAAEILRQHRELLRLEWRDGALATQAQADTPFRPPVFDRLGRDRAQAGIALACATAQRLGAPAYASSYFVPQYGGLGLEVMDLCLPLVERGQTTGYLVANYALNGLLGEMFSPRMPADLSVSFTEADGTRLAVHGLPVRGQRVFTAQQLLDLPGQAMVLRLDSWRDGPDLFPNLLTALVSAMSLALLAVLALLGHDMRRRLRAERDLADALAFRKAMEDSLVTGLRARDLQGRITYVNPAFCSMVGFGAEELLGSKAPAAYWPTEQHGEYQRRHDIRMAGQMPPREGFESVFMRKDGTRFPVLIIEAPLINATGAQTGWMSACLDLSAQRSAEELSRTRQERLQATARLAMVGEMASLLSHELNQPLAAISSYASGSLNLLQGRGGASLASPAQSSLADAVQRIAGQAERAGKIIKSVHDFVRRRDQQRAAVAPQALLDAVMPLVALQARKLGVRVQTDCPPGLPDVLCDRTMVEQVLLNLVRNGMQAMVPDMAPTLPAARGSLPPEGAELAWGGPALRSQAPTLPAARGSLPPEGAVPGLGRPGAAASPLSLPSERVLTIAVATVASPEAVAFSIADSGDGISEEVAAQLFTPFFTTKAEGMGLGLSLCRTVVEQHGGQLSFTPREPRGTVFVFTLPLAQE